MISLPQIQIRQEYARLGIDADLGQWDLKQPRPTFEMKQVPLHYDMNTQKGELHIDQSKAWDALGLGGNLNIMNRIYTEAHNIAMQGIARRAEFGDRLAAIHEGGDPIAENAMERFNEFQEFNYLGPASFDNVDVSYTPSHVDIELIPGRIEINTHPNPPEAEYRRGKLDLYMLNYNKVEIIPPQIDIFA